jgi:hypothetical protein
MLETKAMVMNRVGFLSKLITDTKPGDNDSRGSVPGSLVAIDSR